MRMERTDVTILNLSVTIFTDLSKDFNFISALECPSSFLICIVLAEILSVQLTGFRSIWLAEQGWDSTAFFMWVSR